MNVTITTDIPSIAATTVCERIWRYMYAQLLLIDTFIDFMVIIVIETRYMCGKNGKCCQFDLHVII